MDLHSTCFQMVSLIFAVKACNSSERGILLEPRLAVSFYYWEGSLLRELPSILSFAHSPMYMDSSGKQCDPQPSRMSFSNSPSYTPPFSYLALPFLHGRPVYDDPSSITSPAAESSLACLTESSYPLAWSYRKSPSYMKPLANTASPRPCRMPLYQPPS